MNALRSSRLLLAPCGLALLGVLAACSTAQPYQKPAMEVPAQYREAASMAAATPASAAVPTTWWTLFGDPVLNELQQRLVLGNENLKASAAQMRVAQAAVASAQASLSPTIGVSASDTRNSSTPTSRAGSTYALAGTLSNWEIDLWGRLAQTTDAASARYVASVDDLLAARLSLQATLTQTYFATRAAELQLGTLDRAVLAYQRSLELTQFRQQAGVVSAADVAQAQTQLQNALAQQLETRTQRAQLEHAMATLLGLPAAAFSLAPANGLPPPPRLPDSVPSQLLQRRPDIAAAERRVAAANAQVGVARAAYFPAFTFSASAGYRSDQISQWVRAPNLFWSAGPSLALGLFDGGARQAATESAQASLEQASAQYRQTVLSALQEVEDNLVASSHLGQQTVALKLALQAAQRNLEITQAQYRAGTVSYLNVASAQTTSLSAERSLIDAQNQQLAALNQLLKNLAGNWETPQPPTVRPPDH